MASQRPRKKHNTIMIDKKPNLNQYRINALQEKKSRIYFPMQHTFDKR